MSEALSTALGQTLTEELTKSFGRIRHCMDQLTDLQVWQRPDDKMNAIGNLVLHLVGNLGQYVVSGVGGATDVRNRSAEFSARGPMAKSELLGKLEVVVADARAALERQSEAEWLKARRIQGYEMDALHAAARSVAHFRGHEQEIIHMTRALLGDKYRFNWVPATKEQGATE
jgi:Protein of unknown function (DUF1572)